MVAGKDRSRNDPEAAAPGRVAAFRTGLSAESLAAACLIPGTVAHGIARNLPALGSAPTEIQVDIENPAGILSATIEGQSVGDATRINRAAYKRSAQILLRGYMPLYRESAALKHAFVELRSDSTSIPAMP